MPPRSQLWLVWAHNPKRVMVVDDSGATHYTIKDLPPFTH
jgi:hypothetical protein